MATLATALLNTGTDAPFVRRATEPVMQPLAANDATRWLTDHNQLTAIEHAVRYAA